METSMTRRAFVAGTSAGLLCAAAQLQAAPAVKRICAFEKPLQFLNDTELAEMLGALGFSGVEALVRAGGRVWPAKVAERLPRLRDALAKRGLEITIIATDINAVDQPNAELVLRTAAKLGIRRYRMAWFRYDLSKPILPQLDAFAAKLPALADLTRELGMTAIYQNHSGADTVGAPVWDMYRLLADFDPRTMGIAFDIHHAMVEGGLCWPVQFKLVQSHLAAIYVKDFVWNNADVKDVPLGEGRVGPKFFSMLRESGFDGTICLHVEYMEGVKDKAALENAYRRDLKTLRLWLEA
ncbi:MAG TPA: sugar phosphate isomerase/epimerase family protein [Verrucomicrobiae bacterium]|jgi:sugar phosphate isomerase/epimerase|nr:sugar phosphate isomerase/epimerase family protein [Verrucomicrobiae bacterium]